MQVQAALEKAMQGRTVLVIAPRLSTVSRIYAYLHLHAHKHAYIRAHKHAHIHAHR